MQAFVQYGYRGQELCYLYWYCMLLQVIWVSNICNDTGKEILTDAWEGHQPMDSPFQWPLTVVAQTDWHLWQQALQKCFGLDQWHCLSQPLGKWFPSLNRWFYECTVDWVWNHAPMGWVFFLYIPSLSRTQHFEAESQTLETKPIPQQLF